jgi:mono/diheme cytochrome c family protein
MNARRAVVAAGVLLLAIQAVPVAHTNPPVESDADAPAAVKALLRRACYDCHSHETAWPPQAWVAPTSWLVVHDVNEGREELNFSRWGALDATARAKIAKKLPEEVDEGEMPPWSYRLTHPRARLSAAEKALLSEWARALVP